MLESLLSDKTAGRKTLRKELDIQHLSAIDNFHRNSFYWSYLLKFGGLSCNNKHISKHVCYVFNFLTNVKLVSLFLQQKLTIAIKMLS